MQMMSVSRFQMSAEIVELETGLVISVNDLQGRVQTRRSEYSAKGVVTGERVMLFAWSEVEFFVSLFALQELGAIPFIIDPFQTASELRALNIYISPHWIIDRSMQKHSAETRPPLPADTAMVLFTSGSSALPKAVIHRYENLTARFASARRAIPTEDRQRALCALPLHFGHGLIGVALQTLQDGKTLALAPKLDLQQAAKVGQWIDQYAIEFVSGTPASWSLIARFSSPPKQATLRRLQLASAHATKKLFSDIARWGGVPVFHCYGLSETASWISDARVDLAAEEFPVGSGEQWGTRFRTDPDGLIYVATESLFAGYWGDWTPQAVRTEWYNTGDLGHIRHDGQLVLTGRIKRQINRGGLKVSPEEVETAILETGMVKEVVVLESKQSNETDVGAITAVVVAESHFDRSVLIQNLEKSLREVLSPAKIPSNWRFMDRIPRRSNGKPDLTEIGLMISK